MSTQPDQQTELGVAVLLFVATALILLGVLIGVVLTALSRWRHRDQRGLPDRAGKTQGPDPWEEAGKRVRPFGKK